MGPDALLFACDSEVQRIELWRNSQGELELTLDRVWQFRESEEARFHAFLADVPAVLSPSLRRVLILGGGDGLAARNLLRYPEVESIDLVELDGQVLEMSRSHPAMTTLNAGALDDPRVELHVADALNFVDQHDGPPFDLVICDFPAPTHRALDALFEADFYARVRKLATEHAVVAVQASCPPGIFWPIHAALRLHFAWAEGLLTRLDLDGPAASCDAWANFIVASSAPRHIERSSRSPSVAIRQASLDAHWLRPAGPNQFRSAAYGEHPRFGADEA